jgi:hypothetical protein
MLRFWLFMLICPLFVLAVLTALFALFSLFALSELTALFALAWRLGDLQADRKYYQTNIALAASSLAAKTTALAC